MTQKPLLTCGGGNLFGFECHRVKVHGFWVDRVMTSSRGSDGFKSLINLLCLFVFVALLFCPDY
jgi:hypothetical protein